MGSLTVPSESIYTLYNEYHPAFSNLYTVEIYSGAGNNEDALDMNISSLNNYVRLHARKISFGEEKLSLTRNNVTKRFQVSDGVPFTWIDKLDITWDEADDWKIKKYHEKWLSLFYNKKTDKYVCVGPGSVKDVEDLFRTFVIKFPETESGLTDVVDKEKHCLKFSGVLPSNSGTLNLEWSTNPSIVNYRMSYYVEECEWISDTEKIGSVRESV